MGRIKKIVKDELGVEDVSLTADFLYDLEIAIRDLAWRHCEEIVPPPPKSRPNQPDGADPTACRLGEKTGVVLGKPF